MISAPRLGHFALAMAATALVVLAPGMSGRAVAADAVGCPLSDAEYNIVASVAVRNTMFGAANGVYPMGSGRLGLHTNRGAVELRSFDLVNRLTVRAKVAAISTTVVTTSHTTTALDACRGSARGTLHDGVLTWTSAVSGYHSDGTLECSGAMCGKFGAPPGGTSPFHDAPTALTFNPFTFSADGSTFTMPYMLVSKSSSPRQTTYMALSGRRVKQSCDTTPASTCVR